MVSSCQLCKRDNKLRQSHIIPKFVTKWVKKTSATGYLRGVVQSNLRIQDGIKKEMLCDNCEELFSKYEKYFADTIFFPYLDKKQQSFIYNDNLKKFIISISWRILREELDGFKKHNPTMYPYAKKAEKKWRDFLIGKTGNDRKYVHHLFFLDYIKLGPGDGPGDLPDKFQWYTMRTIDGTIASGEEQVFMYFKFPMMLFVSSIYPKKLDGWHKTEVFNEGQIGPPQELLNEDFGSFLVNRAEQTNISLSDKQQEKILDSFEKNPDRVRTSRSAEVAFEEMKRKRK